MTARTADELLILSLGHAYHGEHDHTLGATFTECMWSLCYEVRKRLGVEGKNTPDQHKVVSATPLTGEDK